MIREVSLMSRCMTASVAAFERAQSDEDIPTMARYAGKLAHRLPYVGLFRASGYGRTNPRKRRTDCS
jgi:hypothetical protein